MNPISAATRALGTVFPKFDSTKLLRSYPRYPALLYPFAFAPLRPLTSRSIKWAAPSRSTLPTISHRSLSTFAINHQTFERCSTESRNAFSGNRSPAPLYSSIESHTPSGSRRFVTTTTPVSQAENPKSEIQESQQILDIDILELQILSKVLSEDDLSIFKKWIECMMDVAYEDFDKRIGIVWDDYLLDISKSPRLLSIDPVKKFVTIRGANVEQFPKSIFSYPSISQILLEKILPVYFNAISQHIKLPHSVYMQTFVLRSALSELTLTQKQHVRWHQDPSDYGNSVADYTLVLMLSNPFDPLKGWDGGELLVKNGMPTDIAPAVRVVPKYNQAVMFNNKKNSHMVTAIKNAKDDTTRDIIIINVYLKDPSL